MQVSRVLAAACRRMKLAVCCLNVSDGRNQHIIARIADAATKDQDKWKPRSLLAKDSAEPLQNVSKNPLKAKATVLSVYSDTVFNRANITIAASLEYLPQSVYQACQAGFHNIDLRQHSSPGHPRLGAVDLVPIHPITSSTSLHECGEVARTVARDIVENIPGTAVFLFGEADGQKRGLIQRRKEMKWFSELENEATNAGEKKITPDLGVQTDQYGLVAIGAIPYMSVLNVMLDTQDLTLGRSIANSIRARSGVGLPGIQAMAFKKEHGVEVACNIDTKDLQTIREGESPEYTDFVQLENRIQQLASEKGVVVLGQSVRGFMPEEAYEKAMRALMEGDTSPWKHITQKFM